MIRMSLLSCIFLTLAAQASVYHCVVNGVITFSQLPCAVDAEKLSQYDSRPTVISENNLAVLAEDALQQISRQTSQQRLNQHLQQLERQIHQIEQTRDARLAELTDGDVQSPEEVANRSYLQGIADEIAALLQDSQAKLTVLHQQADALQQQLLDLEQG